MIILSDKSILLEKQIVHVYIFNDILHSDDLPHYIATIAFMFYKKDTYILHLSREIVSTKTKCGHICRNRGRCED